MSSAWLLSYALLWVLTLALFLVVIGMLRQLGRVLNKVDPEESVLITDDGLPLAEPAPPFEGRDIIRGDLLTFPPADRRKAVFVFISPTCQPCQKLIPDLNEFWLERRQSYEFYVMCSGSIEQVREFTRMFDVRVPILHDADKVLTKLFDHHRTPYAYLVDEHGIVRMKGVVNDGGMLRALVQLRGVHRGGEPWQPVQDDRETADGVAVVGE